MDSKETTSYKPESGATGLTAYKDGREHLFDEFAKLDALIDLQIIKFREKMPHKKLDEFAGLYIAEEEIDRLLEKSPRSSPPSESNSKIEFTLHQLNDLQKTLSTRIETSLTSGIVLPLYQLSYVFHLSSFELDIILICLASELDKKYGILYAYLQNDVTQTLPSVNLVLDLLCNTRADRLDALRYFCTQASLCKYEIITFPDNIQEKPLLSRTLQLDDRITHFLLGTNLPDSRLNSFTELLIPEKNWSAVMMEESLKERLRRLSHDYFDHNDNTRCIFSFYGPYGTGKKLVAEAFCHELDLPLIIVDAKALLCAKDNIEHLITLLFRETLLLPSAIYFEHSDSLFADAPQSAYYHNLIVNAIEEFSLMTFFASEKSWHAPAKLKHQTFLQVEFPIPSYPLRNRLWELSLNGQYSLPPDITSETLANTFRLTGGQIRDAIADATNSDFIQHSSDNGYVRLENLYQSCRAQSNQKLSELTQKIVPHYSWDDIVLPNDTLQQLREIGNYVKYRHIVYDDWGFDRKLSLGKGLNILFSGPSGTGKTMAAEILAHELRLDLYKIDLSAVVSKYIGETEKNLAKIFNEAETSNAILFFDEADSLFGKRSEVKDAHDRYANIEIGYLLQRMEEYTGVVILATNMKKNMDEAFVRRMHFTVEFPFPEEQYRLRIWQAIFPKETPVDETIDFTFLSRKFKITGGNIKNIALNAAFYAADDGCTVTMRHLILAMKREYQKMGRLCVKADFGDYYELIQQ